ncbi:MAG TPA: Calx-beta domain-containing protein [Thermoanaerobaculia bacterium]|nr:Calx-beta domain-containing protein [Thermoanaerobaculia bacterium]
MVKRCLAAGIALLGFGAVLALPAAADEIWIAPGEKADVAVVGDWGLTPAGEAHFTFAVPDSLDRFTGAQVMVIGKKDRAITYDLHLSVSRDGESHNAFVADANGLAATLENDKLTALDASAVFPALAAGQDVVALHFEASPLGDLRVVGLRLEFERFPDHAGLRCGPREVLVGFADETGAPICLNRDLLLEGLLCPPKQFLIGFDPVTGQRRCGDKRVLLAGLSCPPGKFLVGFDDFTGDPVCKTLDAVLGGGGGGEGDLLLGIDNVELTEGHAGTKPFVFTVSLSGPSPDPVTVNFSTRDGDAQAGSDYVATSGTVTFAPGEVNKPITVLVNGDTTPENIEVFFVDLSSPSGATIGDSEGLGRIFDDDGGGGRDDDGG